jgi:molybdopterin-biosynthesis enzyme MoeA-like protein
VGAVCLRICACVCLLHLWLSQLKLAQLPELARLRVAPSDPGGWPILQCANVFILPGVPQYFEAKMGAIVRHFLSGHAVYVGKVSRAYCEYTSVHTKSLPRLQPLSPPPRRH